MSSHRIPSPTPPSPVLEIPSFNWGFSKVPSLSRPSIRRKPIGNYAVVLQEQVQTADACARGLTARFYFTVWEETNF